MVGKAGSNFFGLLIGELGWVGSLSDQHAVGRVRLPILTALIRCGMKRTYYSRDFLLQSMWIRT